MADGHRASSRSWASLLRDCRRRGMRAPAAAVGDGASRFNEVFPETRHQRCWVHERPMSSTAFRSQPSPRRRRRSRASTTSRTASTRPSRSRRFAEQYGAKFPNAVKKIVRRRQGRAAGVLRFPRRALDRPAGHQPQRVDLRDGAATDEGHEGRQLPGAPRDGLQARRVRPSPLAGRERASPRPNRSSLRARPPRGTLRGSRGLNHLNWLTDIGNCSTERVYM